jgi:hypothetical protein
MGEKEAEREVAVRIEAELTAIVILTGFSVDGILYCSSIEFSTLRK